MSGEAAALAAAQGATHSIATSGGAELASPGPLDRPWQQSRKSAMNSWASAAP